MTALSSINFESEYIGQIEFSQAFELQQSLWQKAKMEQINTILGLEHPAVVTLGRRADHNEIHSDNEIPVVATTRGGLATIHSEGQLVIYPIIDLSKIKIGVRDFVCLLLKVTQNVFLNLNIKTYIDDQNIGLYTDNGKIAFCGLQIKSRISLHGLSINISNDLNLFNSIKSCGIENSNLDRLHEYRNDITVAEFYKLWLSELSRLNYFNNGGRGATEFK